MNGSDNADKDPLTAAFDAALSECGMGTCEEKLIKVAAAYRERAAYFEGRCDGRDDATFHLRRLAMILDPRRDEVSTFRFGMFVARAVDATEAEADGQAEPAEAPAPTAPA